MDAQQIIEILKVRQSVAEANGNTTELSLLYELVKMAEEYKELKASIHIHK